MGIKGHTIKIFADGADLQEIKKFHDAGLIDGFTTNPFFLNQYGVKDYEGFIKEAIGMFPGLSMSFEVLSDDLETMEKEALLISGWSDNIHVKIPILNTKGESTGPIIKKLSDQGVKLNITVIFTMDQVKTTIDSLNPEVSSYISVFAGRIASTGVDPIPTITATKELIDSKPLPKAEILWASTREIFNIFEAERSGCGIITVGYDLLGQMGSIGKSLDDSAVDMVKMFADATTKGGFRLDL